MFLRRSWTDIRYRVNKLHDYTVFRSYDVPNNTGISAETNSSKRSIFHDANDDVIKAPEVPVGRLRPKHMQPSGLP